MSYQADNKKEDFRRYLEKNGIIDSLTKVLVGLYEEPDKPDNPLDFIKQFLAGPQIGPVSADMLKAENEDLKARTAVLAERLDAAIRKLRELGVQISDDGIMSSGAGGEALAAGTAEDGKPGEPTA